MLAAAAAHSLRRGAAAAAFAAAAVAMAVLAAEGSHAHTARVANPVAGKNNSSMITGLVAAVYSPIAANQSLDINPDSIDAQAAYLASTGVGTAFVCGTTGESVDLTVAERMALVEAWVGPCRKHNLTLMVHVGTDSVVDARRLAEHAASVGAWGIASMPPTYIKPADVPSLVSTMAFVAAGAPSLPFYYYHIPSMTGVDLKMSAFLAAVDATGAIPSLAGVKFTDTDLADLLLCVRTRVNGRAPNMLYGMDAQLLSALVLGVHGAVGSTYNFNGEVEGRVLSAFQRGNLAAAADAQSDVASFIADVYHGVPNVNGGKALMNLIGAGRGGALRVGPPRLPQRAPNATDVAAVRTAAKAWCRAASQAPSWCADI